MDSSLNHSADSMPRLTLRDRLNAALAAFKNPNDAYQRGIATGIAIYPSVKARARQIAGAR